MDVPFRRRRAGRRDRHERDQNPHKRGTTAYSDWNAGYDSGKEADDATKLDHDWPGESD